MTQHDEKKTLRKLDFITGIVLLVISVFFIFQSWKLLQRTFSKGGEWYLSAGLVPMVVCIALAICSLVLIVNAIKSKVSFAVTPEKLKKSICNHNFFTTVFIIVWFAAHIFVLLEFLSYELATITFLVVFIAVFAEKNLKKIGIGVVVSVVITLAIAYCFGSLVGIPLP